MKTKIINVVGIIYFTLVNTQYFWEQNLGFFAMISTMILFLIFILLVIASLYQLYKLSREKFEDKKRFISLLLMTSILSVTYLNPFGIVNFEKFELETVLEASSTGGGGCNSNLKLYDDNTFKDCERCFSTSRTKGKWKLVNDTIYFSNVKRGITTDWYYKSAIIVKSTFPNSKSTLIRYIDDNDTVGRKMWISKNKLIK